MIPMPVRNAINVVYSYAGPMSDWTDIKREVVKNTPSKFRSLFSLRNPVTKKQRINNFELEVIKLWSQIASTNVSGIPEEVDDGIR